MKKGFLFIIISLIIAGSTQAQTIYHLKYQLSETDTTSYDAFMVLTGAGGGFARVNFWSAENQKAATVEVQLEETFLNNANGEIDETSIGYKTLSPKVVIGSKNAVFKEVVFWFKEDADAVIQPWGVTNLNGDAKEALRAFDTAMLVKQEDLKKVFVLQYFNRRDSVYQLMFEGVARGPNAVNTSNMTMHIIIVANVNDTSIGPSAAKDKDDMLKMLNNLAGTMKVKTSTIIISGNNYSKKSLLSALSKFKPNQQDMVIFYYSGHGFRKSTTPLANLPKDSIFPHLDLRANYNQDYMKESLGIDSVYRTLLRKGARFNLVLGDCCNAAVQATNTVGKPPGATRGPELEKSMRNIETMFLNPAPTSILATSANVQELASSNNKFGGFFSYFFRSTLNFYLSPMRVQPPSWDALLFDAQTQTAKKASNTICKIPNMPSARCKQKPIYNVLGK